MRTRTYKTAVCLIVSFLIAWSVHAEESESIPALQNEQYVLLRLSPDSKAEIEHYMGDEEATLIVKNPVPNTIEMLASQEGNLMVDVKRKSLIGDELRVGLELARPDIRIHIKVLEHPKSLTLGFFTSVQRPLPSLENLLLLLPSAYPPSEPVMVMPPRPSKHPCQGISGIDKTIEAADQGHRLSKEYLQYAKKYVRNELCQSYIEALNAEAILKSGENVVDAENWAFAMSEAPIWKNYRDLYEYYAFVAANVLIDLSLFPEAELLLAKMDQAADDTLIPYVKLTLSRFFLQQQKYEEASIVLDRLLTKFRKGTWRYHAFLNATIVTTRTNDREKTRALALDAEKTLRADEKDGGALWLIGAEAALALNDYKNASKLYKYAMKVGGEWDRSLALMRLGELAAIKNPNTSGVRSAHRFFDMARKSQPNIYFTQILRFKEELIYDILTSEIVDLRKIEDAFADAFQPSARLEIAYAMAKIHIERGESRKALNWLLPLLDDKSYVREENKVVKALTQAVNDIIGHFARSGQWLEVARSYEGELEPFRGMLDNESLIAVSDAYYHLNLPKNSVEMLMWIMNTRNPSKQSEYMTAKLAEAYGAMKDHFRFEMVAKYYLSRFPRSPHKWKILILEVRSLLQQDRFEEADQRFKTLWDLVPDGDPKAEADLLMAELCTRQNRFDEAANHFVKVLQSDTTEDVEIERIGTMLLSPCMQNCSLDTSEKLLAVASDWDNGRLVDDAVRFFAKMRDVSMKDNEVVSVVAKERQASGKPSKKEEKSNKLWRDLLELAPELPELKEIAEKKRKENLTN